MSENNTRLRIHAQIKPENEPQPTKPQRPERSPKPRKKLTFTDRLLRNSALACAILLAVLALGNIDHPWAQRTSETIERALTMHIDLDESIGRMSFVRRLMPESALVFFNLPFSGEFAQPIGGELTHPYSEAQPWLMYSCPGDSPVRAIADGTVTAVSTLSDGSVGILIDHGSGLESVYAYISEADVQPGSTVLRGEIIASSAASLYFELREGGSSVDPSERMGLRA